MKGTVFNIRSFSVHDGPGIRLTVFLKGCPLNCFWCHNPESRSPEKEVFINSQKVGDKCFEVDETIGYEMCASEILERALADKAFFEESGGGITLSGGEPMFQHEFVAEILQLCKKHDIHTALDTSGFAPTQFFEQVLPYTDLFLFDLKLMDDAQHIQHTGESNKLILKNLQHLIDQNQKIIIRIPLIPGVTDTVANLTAIKGLLQKHKAIERIDLLPYHNLAKAKYARMGTPGPSAYLEGYPKEKATEIRSFFQESVSVVSIGG